MAVDSVMTAEIVNLAERRALAHRPRRRFDVRYASEYELLNAISRGDEIVGAPEPPSDHPPPAA